MEKQTSAKSLAAKLFIRPKYNVLLINAPRGYQSLLRPLPEGSRIVSKSTKPVEMIQLFASTKSEMSKHFAAAKPLLKDGGLLWAT
ncbi:MAG: hypothetical protein ACRD36_04485 [Candidatus Acidiferrum sp.]